MGDCHQSCWLHGWLGAPLTAPSWHNRSMPPSLPNPSTAPRCRACSTSRACCLPPPSLSASQTAWRCSTRWRCSGEWTERSGGGLAGGRWQGCLDAVSMPVTPLSCATPAPIHADTCLPVPWLPCSAVFYRERAAGMYTALPMAVAQGNVEIPYLLLQTVLYRCAGGWFGCAEWVACQALCRPRRVLVAMGALFRPAPRRHTCRPSAD